MSGPESPTLRMMGGVATFMPKKTVMDAFNKSSVFSKDAEIGFSTGSRPPLSAPTDRHAVSKISVRDDRHAVSKIFVQSDRDAVRKTSVQATLRDNSSLFPAQIPNGNPSLSPDRSAVNRSGVPFGVGPPRDYPGKSVQIIFSTLKVVEPEPRFTGLSFTNAPATA